MTEYEALLDYRRLVAELYAQLRRSEILPLERFAYFKEARDRLFRTHLQSPLSGEQRTRFKGLRYFPYDPALSFLLEVDGKVEREVFEIELSTDGRIEIERFGKVHFSWQGLKHSLSLFWIKGYGGGVFLPFKDSSNSQETYGGGRYLLDTIKHADLGQQGAKLVLDFNFAYNPSCAYNSRWSCPLAPVENSLPVPLYAGERAFGLAE